MTAEDGGATAGRLVDTVGSRTLTTDEDDSLRARRARAVRAELRDAFVRLAAARGIDAVPLADVAEAAGVSERTLYRHYPNREALLEAIIDEDVATFDEAAAATGAFELEDPDALARNFALFAEHEDLMRIGRALRVAGEDRSASAGRTAHLRERLRDVVHPDALEQVVGVVRALGGVDAWLRMREPDIDLDDRQAGRAAQWAIQVLVAAAHEADGPLSPAAGPPEALLAALATRDSEVG